MVNINDIFREEKEDRRKELVNNRLKEIDSLSKQNVLISTKTNYRGFISSTSKVAFSDDLIDIGEDSCSSSIHLMKTQDYIPLFIEYIKSKKITNANYIIMAISPFLHEYFGCKKDYTNENNREKYYIDIGNKLGEIKSKDEYNKYYNEWFDIGEYKGSSMAECSEYAILSQNILSFLGIESYYISGQLNDEIDLHAYNIIKYMDKVYIMDYSNPIILYDEKFNIIDSKANSCELSDEEFNDFKEGKGINISFNRCNYQNKNNQIKPIDQTICKYKTNSSKNVFSR